MFRESKQLYLEHEVDHGGEIACLKGLQGMIGYRNEHNR